MLWYSVGVADLQGDSCLQPRILFINRVYPPDGGATGRLLADLSHWMADAGWCVTVLATGARETEDTNGHVRVVRAVVPGGRGVLATFAQLRALRRRARGLPPADLIVTMTDPPLLALLGPGLRCRGAALLHWCHDLYPDLLAALGVSVPPAAERLLSAMTVRALARHDEVIAIGTAMAARLADRGASARTIEVIANWADPAIRPDPTAVADFRHVHGFEGRIVVMYAGNFGRLYGFAGLLDAAAVLADRRPDVLFALVGGGARLAETRAGATRRGLPNIRFLPHQPRERLAACLGAADLHLAMMPEAALGLMEPCKVTGVLAAGRPCVFVGPARSDAGQLIAKSGAGDVVDPSDLGALVRTIESLADQPDRRIAMAGRALATSALYRLETAAPKFEAVARQLLLVSQRRGHRSADRTIATAPKAATETVRG